MIRTPESEFDNIEYKRELHPNIEPKRKKQLAAQMLRRINNGIELFNKPEAIYYIGVNDDGTLANVTEENLQTSIVTLKNLALENQCDIKNISIKNSVAEITLTKNRNSDLDTRVLFIGPPYTDKTSTRISLTGGEGESNIFYNSSERIIFDSDSFMSIQGMVLNSDKIITILDISGKKKYINETIKTIFSNKSDHIYIFYTPGCFIEIVLKYIRLSKFLDINYTVIATKINMSGIPEELAQEKDTDNIMFINNDTQEGIDELHNHLCSIKPTRSTKPVIRSNEHELENIDVMFGISNIINSNFGIIIDGVCYKGAIKTGDKLLVGPSKEEFCQVKIETIHKKQTPYDYINENEDASILIIPTTPFKVTKGMLLFSKNLIPKFRSTFYVQISSGYNFKIEKYMKFMAFMTNNYYKIYVIKDIFIDSIYHIYKCKLHKDRKRLFINNEKIGLRHGNTIIEGIVKLNI